MLCSTLASDFKSLISVYIFLHAGRYVGSRPIKLRKSTWENRGLGQVRKREKQQKQLLGIIKPGQ